MSGKIKQMSEFYIAKIKTYVQTHSLIQPKPLFKETVGKNLIDLVTISQRLFILEYKVRQGKYKIETLVEDELTEVEKTYAKFTPQQVSEEIIRLCNLSDYLLDMTDSYFDKP